MEEIQKLVETYIQYNKEFLLLELKATLFGITVCVIVGVLMIRQSRWTKSVKLQLNKKVIMILYISFIVISGLSLCMWDNIARMERVSNLSKDLRDFQFVDSTGKVEDNFAYIKGGGAVIVCGEIYYILPSIDIGKMYVDKIYNFTYLPNSNYIVSFELKKNTR